MLPSPGLEPGRPYGQPSLHPLICTEFRGKVLHFSKLPISRVCSYVTNVAVALNSKPVRRRMPSDNPGRQYRFRTGTIALYDADTGVLSGKVTLEAAPHYQVTRGVINFSNDSRYLYYWFDQHLYVIDLENNRVASKQLTLPDRFDPVAVVSGR